MSDEKSQKIEYLPIDSIVAESQVRKDFGEEALAGLAQSVKKHGILQPIQVRPHGGKYVLVAGERRLRAARLAGEVKIPAVVVSDALSESAIGQRQLIENCQREDLTPLEKAEGFDRLMRMSNSTAKDVASQLGLSVATVSRHLSLLKLPQAIREQVANGSLSASSAYEIAQLKDPAEQLELAARAASGTLSRDTLTGRRKARERSDSTPSGAGLRRATAMLGGGRLVTVAAEKLNLEAFIAALEELLGKARKVRPTGVELTTFLRMLRDTTVEKAS